VCCCVWSAFRWTGILQFAIAHTSWIGLVRIVSIFGAAALAGYTIAIRIVIFVILPFVGIEQRGSHARRPEFRRGTSRTRRKSCLAHRALQCDVSWGRRPGLHIFPEPIVRLFTKDPAVVPLGAACLRIISYGNLGYAYFMVMMQAFNGAGDTITPPSLIFSASGYSRFRWPTGWRFR